MKNSNINRNRIIRYMMIIGASVVLLADVPFLQGYQFPLVFLLATVIDHSMSALLLGLVFRFYYFKQA